MFYFQIQIVTSVTVTESTVSVLAVSNVKMDSISLVPTASTAHQSVPNVRDLQHAQSVLREDMVPNASIPATVCVQTVLVHRSARRVSLDAMVHFASFTVLLAALIFSAKRILAHVPLAAGMDII